MESSFWETCLPYLEIGDDEQLVCHQSDQQQSFPVFCHQPSTSVQNLHDLITFSPITFNNLVSFDDYDVGSVPSTVQKACTKQESGRDSVNQFGSRISRNRGTRKGRNSKTGTLDHVIAERNRRHELAEKFLALSATIPGLKKTDKASILDGAINYVKQLQQRIKELDQRANKKKSMKSAILSSKISYVEELHTCGHNKNNVLPDVKARALERQVLIKILCNKQNDIVLNIVSLLEKTHLTVTSSSILPSKNSTLNVTIIAQMRDEYGMTVDDLVKNLRRDLFKLREDAWA